MSNRSWVCLENFVVVPKYEDSVDELDEDREERLEEQEDEDETDVDDGELCVLGHFRLLFGLF